MVWGSYAGPSKRQRVTTAARSPALRQEQDPSPVHTSWPKLADYATELSACHGHPEDSAGWRCRLHNDSEAGITHPASRTGNG